MHFWQFPKFKNGFLAIFEIAKNGIWSKKFFREIAFLAVLNFFPVQKWIFGHFWNCKKWNLAKKNFSMKMIYLIWRVFWPRLFQIFWLNVPEIGWTPNWSRFFFTEQKIIKKLKKNLLVQIEFNQLPKSKKSRNSV